MRHILLDSSPLGLLSKPIRSDEVTKITDWSKSCLAAGYKLYVPEVIDYELRRELVRAGKTAGVAELDNLGKVLHFLPITTATMRRAAELWADARRHGLPTGDPKKLDIDVILAAQALTLAAPLPEIVVATANVGHLSRFVAADLWTNINP